MRNFEKTFFALWRELREEPSRVVIKSIMRHTYHAGLHVFYPSGEDYVFDRHDLEQFKSKEV